jgi:hypothetical protein
VTQQEWTNPYQQPVSDSMPAGGWRTRFKLQEIQKATVNLAAAAGLRLELIREEADGTVFWFAAVNGMSPACNTPDLLLWNLHEHLKDVGATIEELGRRVTTMEPETKVWDSMLRIKPRGERQ